MAGRKGIYVFDATTADGSEGTWTVMTSGFAESVHFNRVDGVPWMGGIQFDPTLSGKAYAFKATDGRTLSDWTDPRNNANIGHAPGCPFRPMYQSDDWGETWSSMDTPDFPDWLTVNTIHVTERGTLYVGSANSGLYRHDP